MNTNGSGKRKTIIGIIVALIICICIGIAVYHFLFSDTDEEEVVVSSVSTWMGNLDNGMRNRYQGIVESNESWKAPIDTERTIKEYKVKVGDKVQVGTPLFEYDNSSTEEAISSAKMEIQRMQDDLAAMNADLRELNTERGEAADQMAAAEILVDIQQKQLDIRNKNYDLAAKQKELSDLENSLGNTTVNSEIKGVVKSLGNEDDGSGDGLMIVNIKSFQIKGKVNEQNLSNLYEKEKVIIFSRVSNDVHWKGKISKIDKDNTLKVSEDFDEDEDEMTKSSSYPFYINLKKTKGLSIGQHVYIEENIGQLKNKDKEFIELDEELILDIDKEAPYVWADDGSGRLEKRTVTLGEYNKDAHKYPIVEGLKMSDLIAQPKKNLKPGMKTVDANKLKDQEESGDDEDSDSDEDEDDDGDE